MSLSKLISNYAAYNEWANQRIVDWLKPLDKNLLHHKTPSSFNSLDYTLQHILRAQNFWLLFISEKDFSNFSWAVRENEVETILSELLVSSYQMKITFSNFSEAELNHVLHLKSKWAKNDLPRYEYINHVINHTTYHRGQIITMARCLGITENVPNTDYNMFNCI